MVRDDLIGLFKMRTKVSVVIASFCLAIMMIAIDFSRPETTLKQKFAKYNRYFGTATDVSSFNSPNLMALIGQQFSALTPENQMKWSEIERLPGRPIWTASDQLVDFARRHQQIIRGHTLVWHKQLPTWLALSFANADELETILKRHIREEVGHFAGKIYAWDVINEPLSDSGEFRKSIWFSVLGSHYIETALRTAHVADPNAKLYINEFDVSSDNAKMMGLLRLLNELKRADVPIDGVGIQGHFAVGEVPNNFARDLAEFAALDLDVAITELDIRIEGPPDAEKLQRQAEDYKTIADACLQVPRCVGITTWGVTDARSWIPKAYPGRGHALLFDENLEPKPAYEKLMEVYPIM